MSHAIFQLLGFFAGIHLAILAAYVCQRYPNASVNGLFTMFFEIFAHWPWQNPVSLHGQPTNLRRSDGCLMAIVMPCTPPEFCGSNMTKGTFKKIREELMRGYALTKVSFGPVMFFSLFLSSNGGNSLRITPSDYSHVSSDLLGQIQCNWECATESLTLPVFQNLVESDFQSWRLLLIRSKIELLFKWSGGLLKNIGSFRFLVLDYDNEEKLRIVSLLT